MILNRNNKSYTGNTRNLQSHGWSADMLIESTAKHSGCTKQWDAVLTIHVLMASAKCQEIITMWLIYEIKSKSGRVISE